MNNTSETEVQVRMPPRVNILGVGVHATNPGQAVRIILNTVHKNGKGYVCVTGVHGVVESQSDDALKTIHNQSLLMVPDGMPSVWMGRIHSHSAMRRVYGPDLMTQTCQESVKANVSHFLYGGNTGVAETLREELGQRFPGLNVVGTYSPPFRPLHEEEQALKSQIDTQRPWWRRLDEKRDHLGNAYYKALVHSYADRNYISLPPKLLAAMLLRSIAVMRLLSSKFTPRGAIPTE